MARSTATGNQGACRYRGHGGLRCAIGALIDDAHYSKELEGHAASAEPVTDALRLSGVTRVSRNFLDELQEVHDGSEPLTWRSRLQTLAIEEGLSMPEGL
jgi:hypothetical protein